MTNTDRICTKSHSTDAWEDVVHNVSDCTPVEYNNGFAHKATVVAEVVYAEDREETDYCERSTQGCSVDHTHSKNDSECETW